VSSADAARFEALKAWRRATALEQGVPAYVVFHDKTLLEVARLNPAGLSELRGVSGVGESKLARYGEAILQALRGASVLAP
jgi:ATP-dependent DNA helicase RecQ